MATTKKTTFQTVTDHGLSYWLVLAVLAGVTGIGFLAAYYMEHHGHYVTGMSNQVIWGLPHVFAIFLIVAASGALNVASVGSVFGKVEYKPLGRLSGLLAMCLLVGGLGVLVLDLGRPDRLIKAMTYFNMKSIFTWNILLYTGFLGVVGLYMMTMFIKSWAQYTKAAGTAAFIWRFILTTGTGSIFGFLVSRQAYDAAILAPMFISASLSFGTAIYMLILMWIYKSTGRDLGDEVMTRLKRLNAVLAVATLFFVVVYHLTNLYATQHHGVEGFILASGSVYTKLFWLGQVLIGTLIPVALFWSPKFQGRGSIIAGASMIILGGFSMIYVVVVGGQAYPMDLIAGMEVSSSFADGQVAHYAPSLPEFLLGMGGVAFAVMATLFVVKVLPFVPRSLADPVTDQAV
ncbi:MAG: polysulfide reductase NrfD [Proteobacteria bacterium]|nr:polysulfide reductase NrfD [Pseudomonadota bacterium]